MAMAPAVRRSRGIILTAVLLVCVASPVAGDQVRAPGEAVCVRTWVEHEPGIEAFMRGADVARLEAVPIGVTRPWRAFFAPGGPVASIAWKPLPPARRGGYWESYKSEIAAYELDKLLALHMVPPVVERTVDGKTGAAVMWVAPVSGWNMKKPVHGPEPEWSRQVSRMKLFDQLIANIDRNQGNLLYDADWHLLLIDHSRAFTDRATLAGVSAPSWIDRGLWTRIEALTLDELQRVLGPWLDTRAIHAIVSRRDLMRRAIERNVSRKGERAVFLP